MRCLINGEIKEVELQEDKGKVIAHCGFIHVAGPDIYSALLKLGTPTYRESISGAEIKVIII